MSECYVTSLATGTLFAKCEACTPIGRLIVPKTIRVKNTAVHR